ncbi:hypothetical protein JCM14469_05120 [Desulfatiferula olefinivorans]
MKPLVSIVIPTFNQADYLPACVDHCLCQTYEHLEIIIVDGGSTDGTKHYLSRLEEEIRTAASEPLVRMSEDGGIVRERQLRFPQNRIVKIITFDNDIGATPTYNKGLKRVTGDCCTYVVGDDIPHPHMIERLVHAMVTTKADFVYSDMNVVDDRQRIIRQIRLPDYDFKTCFADWYHLGVSHLYKTKLHHLAGYMDEAYQSANDYDHYLRFAMNGAVFHHVPEILYSVRYHGDNRKTGQHTDGNHQRLIDESRACARRARAFFSSTTTMD